MTPIARGFSPEEILFSNQQLGMRLIIMPHGNPTEMMESLAEVAKDLQCTVNHLTAQVEEARRLLEMMDGGGMKIGPDEWYPKRKKWLSATPVREEGEL